MTTIRKTSIERLRTMADSERVRADDARDLLNDLEVDQIRDLAGVLEEFASSIESAVEAVDTYQDAEGREEKADAKDAALEALAAVCDAFEADLSEFEVPAYLRAEFADGEVNGEDPIEFVLAEWGTP